MDRRCDCTDGAGYKWTEQAVIWRSRLRMDGGDWEYIGEAVNGWSRLPGEGCLRNEAAREQKWEIIVL